MLKLTGAKWMPILQAFYPHEQRFYPFWDLCQSLGAPVLIHGGTTALGQGMEGGGGLKLDYARPMPCIDAIAADFPKLTIVIAHPGLALDRGGDRRAAAQEERVHGYLGLAAALHPAGLEVRDEPAPAGQDPVRIGLPGLVDRTVPRRIADRRHQGSASWKRSFTRTPSQHCDCRTR